MGREFHPNTEMEEECSLGSIETIERMAQSKNEASRIRCPLGMGNNVIAFNFDAQDEYEKFSLKKIFKEMTGASGMPNFLIYSNNNRNCFCLVQTIGTPGSLELKFRPIAISEEDTGPTP